MEFACVLPLLMLLALGCVDFGRVAYGRIAVSNAAGAGAAYAATHRATAATRGAWDAAIRAIVAEDLRNLPRFDESLLETITQIVEDPDGGVRVAVEVRYPFETAVEWPGLPHLLHLRERVVSVQYR